MDAITKKKKLEISGQLTECSSSEINDLDNYIYSVISDQDGVNSYTTPCDPLEIIEIDEFFDDFA